jgi:hypothetical protein
MEAPEVVAHDMRRDGGRVRLEAPLRPRNKRGVKFINFGDEVDNH